MRLFEVVSYDKGTARCPERATKHSAGYDFFSAVDITIPANKRKPTLVKTNIKACMEEDEALFLYNRSSNPGKKDLVLANGVGVVDSDYYNNPDNEGNIMFAFYNVGERDVEIHVGDKLGQGVFQKYLIAYNDIAGGERTGGFGSTEGK